ncbi:MAG: EAL domain-containing protein [Planctomycetota bacterium]|nr:EAL domain-containing protein [Planctomycetota bacterium]
MSRKPFEDSGASSHVVQTAVFDRPGRILIIDDHEPTCRMLEEVLAHRLHTVFLAHDGKSGLELAARENPDLILLDINLPDLSGFEVCKKLSADPLLRHIPIVMITGAGDADTQIQGLASGASDVLVKPLQTDVLCARVRSILKYRHAVAELRRARDQLEKRVAERTQDLAKKNEELRAEIAERKRIEAALRASEERYALAAKGANDGLWDWDLERGTLYFSPRWREMAGAAEAELGDDPEAWFSRVHAEDRATLRGELERHRKGLTEHFSVEYRFRQADGAYRWMLCRGLAVRDAQGKPTRIAGSQTDIHQEKTANLQLRHNAFHDELTGLPNRFLFLDRLEQIVQQRLEQPEALYGILYFGLDRFKLINTSLGHEIGDQLLKHVAARLRESVSPQDTAARIGSDEFAVLLAQVPSVAGAMQEADRLRSALLKPCRLQGREVFASASVGISLRSPKPKSAEVLLRDADTAMRRAKDMGKARKEIYHSDLHAASVLALDLESELRRALEGNEFFLHYQPIVDIARRETVGFEALIRWESPQRGMVPPGDFIAIAEETSMIEPISRWVLREACRQLKHWLAEISAKLPWSMSVNMPGRVFEQSEWLPYIDLVLKETGLDPQRLKLEITERALVDPTETVMHMISELKRRGVKLLVDDFGTGYSSLSYLQQLPFDLVKIDHSFVSRLTDEEESIEFLRNILALAHSRKMEVIAEGVETQAQADLLAKLGCEYAQGYLYAKPLSAEQIQAKLKAH